jgi:hypothetical protein
MNKEAWLLDEDILYKGLIKRKWFRHIFIPNSHEGGFSYQYVTKKDIGKIIFKNDVHIVYAGLGQLERINGENLEYGLIKEYKDSDLWFEPITDEIDGFVIRSKDGVEIIAIYDNYDKSR